MGSVDERALFTASQEAGEGSITVSAGGLTHTIQVVVGRVHEDVTEDHWAYEAVEYLYEKVITAGIISTLFGRDLIVSRADFMVMLHNAMGRPAAAAPCTFTDVDAGSDYYPALSWAQHVGLANGVGGGLFAPGDNLSREQAFTLFDRFLPIFGKECPKGNLSALDQFADRDQIADFAWTATATLVEQKLVLGDGSSINPKGTLTRAEMAVLLRRVLEHTPIATDPGKGDKTVTVTASWNGLTASCAVTCQPARWVGAVNAESGLRVRSGPDTTYTAVGTLRDKERVVVLSQLTGWYQILYRNTGGQAAIGYVSADYLTVEG